MPVNCGENHREFLINLEIWSISHHRRMRWKKCWQVSVCNSLKIRVRMKFFRISQHATITLKKFILFWIETVEPAEFYCKFNYNLPISLADMSFQLMNSLKKTCPTISFI